MQLNGIELTAENIVDNAVESVRIKKIPPLNVSEREQ
jgi:hypothetical protein